MNVTRRAEKTATSRVKKDSVPHALGARIVDGGLFLKPGEVVIGIDQSYTGFAITAAAQDSARFFTWCKAFKGHGVDRLLDIEHFLTMVLEELEGEDMVVRVTGIEGYAFGSQMANMLGELGYAVKRTIREFYGDAGYPWIVPTMTLKMYATSRGKQVSKAEILLAVYKNWGVEFRDDNMADSFVIAQMMKGYDKLAYQRAQLDKLKAVKADGTYVNREGPV